MDDRRINHRRQDGAGPRHVSTFFCTKKKYKDFELSFQVRLTNGVGGSGVQIRSTVVNDPRSSRYPARKRTWASSIWGDLYGYRFSPDGKSLDNGFGHRMKKADFAALNVKQADFNDYSVRVVGKRVTIKVNGVVAVDQEFPILPERELSRWNSTRAARWK